MRFLHFVVIGIATFNSSDPAYSKSRQTSGIYETSSDYQNDQLNFAGSCGSKFHRIELHNELHRPYIDVTQGNQKQRLLKANLFGLHACDGYDYRFDGNLEYRILEAKDADIYESLTHASRYQNGIIWTFYFSANLSDKILPLTVNDLKQAYSQNHTFVESLESNFPAHEKIEQYDDVHNMFKVNYLLHASNTHQP
jgi:hypothetical protein